MLLRRFKTSILPGCPAESTHYRRKGGYKDYHIVTTSTIFHQSTINRVDMPSTRPECPITFESL